MPERRRRGFPARGVLIRSMKSRNKELDEKIKEALESNLPVSSSVGRSKVTGRFESRRQRLPHEKGMIILDNEMDSSKSGEIYRYLVHFMEKNEYYRDTSFRVKCWMAGAFETVGTNTWTGISVLKKREVELDGNASGDSGNFASLYEEDSQEPGIVILICSADKAESVRSGVKDEKLVILFPGVEGIELG